MPPPSGAPFTAMERAQIVGSIPTSSAARISAASAGLAGGTGRNDVIGWRRQLIASGSAAERTFLNLRLSLGRSQRPRVIRLKGRSRQDPAQPDRTGGQRQDRKGDRVSIPETFLARADAAIEK